MHFVIPQNYNFRSRLFGLFDYPTLIFNVVWFVFLFAISNLCFADVEVKIVFCTILYLPVFIFSFIGVRGENLFAVVFSVCSFVKNRKVLFYSK